MLVDNDLACCIPHYFTDADRSQSFAPPTFQHKKEIGSLQQIEGSMIELTNQHATLQIDADGFCALVDRKTGTNYFATDVPFFSILKAGESLPAITLLRDGERLTVEFPGARAVLRITEDEGCFLFEVVEVQGDIEQLTFLDLRLDLPGTLDEPFIACALALNLQTNVPDIPGPMTRPQAMCYARTGLVGAKAALIACPPKEMRGIMQEVVSAAPDLPHSQLGGPWALDAPLNRGSYLFNFTDCTEEKVDEWITLAKAIGFTQLDFHGGQSFRFGDCEPNPELYPEGRKSLKRVIDRLHDAGIAAGLHTYAHFIHKSCPWVTPVPDPRLGSDSVFTLAAPLDADATELLVRETTECMSTITGFFVRNSVTFRIDEELITYAGIAPGKFTGCTRGACGTKPSAHAAGAKAYHLKECFGLFAPDGDNTLLEEVAAATARTFNECGFDMMYLDALDGEDILGGTDWGWHYGSKFVFEIWKRIGKPALQEMSTFHHHLWYVRSRFGAWDHPNRAHKHYIDIHAACNAKDAKMFLPAHLGWWASTPFTDQQNERTFPDVHEYLCAKAAGNDTGFALMGINPASLESPELRCTAGILQRWENLRHSGTLSAEMKARLREPGAEFTLREDGSICPISYLKHKAEGSDARWTVDNPFGPQQPRLRIEALFTAEPYDSAEAETVLDFTDVSLFTERGAANAVSTELSPADLRPGAGRFIARNHGTRPNGAWAKMRRYFTPPLNLHARQGLGVWVYGDGQGEVLNVQLRSPLHVSNALGEHYIIVDFTGWRYFELIEPESDRYRNYRWPYAVPENTWESQPLDEEAQEALHWYMGGYHIYRERVEYDQVECIALYLNNVPEGKEVTVHIGPIKALPLKNGSLVHPILSVNGETVTLPVTLETGQYLELEGDGAYTVYGPDGAVVLTERLAGAIPQLNAGQNEIAFTCEQPDGYTPRAQVTVISHGKT